MYLLAVSRTIQSMITHHQLEMVFVANSCDVFTKSQ